MNFRQMSAMLSSKVKQQISEEHNRDQDEIDFLLDSQYINSLWNQFTSEEMAVIQYFLRFKGTDLLTYRELEQGQFSIPAAKFRVGLTKLRRKGIIFTLRRLWGELAFIIPKEFIRAFRMQVLPFNRAWIVDQQMPCTSSYHIYNGIYQVLNYVRAHSIPLTKKGTVQKKEMRLLTDLFGLPKESFAACKRLDMVLHPYENHEAIILDLLTGWRLLTESGSAIAVGDIEGWVQLSDDQRHEEMLAMLERYLDLDQKLLFVYDIMCTLAAGCTYSLTKILQQMDSFSPAVSDVEQRILSPLSHFGLIKYMVYNDQVLWEWVREPVFEQCQLYVQPNYEILIPKFAPLKLKWEIGGYADLISQEEMWSFALRRESIRRATEAGKGSEEIICHLQTHSAMALPENVVQSVNQWQKDYQKIRFFDARIMEVEDPELASQLEKVEAIAKYVLRRLGNRYFAIRAEGWEALVSELEKRGYPSGGLDSFGLNQHEPQEPLKVFKPMEHKVEYKVESVFPDLEDAIPGLRQIPRIWTANFQPYHASTLRELVSKALNMGVALKLQWKGKIYEIIPSTLSNKDGYWVIQGADTSVGLREYRLDDIERIQVIIP